MATRKVTFASMGLASGPVTYYNVYRATLHFNLKNREDYVDLVNAERVAVVARESHEHLQHVPPFDLENWLHRFYYEMTAPFATPEWPAFSWGYEPDTKGEHYVPG